MFSAFLSWFPSWKFKLILAAYLLLVVLIPTGSYFLAQQSKSASTDSANPIPTPVTSARPTPTPSSTTFNLPPGSTNTGTVSNLSFGPTLNLTIALEGRPKNNQASKVFVGFAQGQSTSTPKYLLTFTLDFPASGIYQGLSLAGLEIGTSYTAYIKGPSHIATSSAFTINPTETTLNSGQPINMLAGDLNEDNRVDSNDYQILLGLLNATSKSPNWNERADINADLVINSADLAYITKNLGRVGSSGVWQSTPKPASGSAYLEDGVNATGGYWLFVPDL